MRERNAGQRPARVLLQRGVGPRRLLQRALDIHRDEGIERPMLLEFLEVGVRHLNGACLLPAHRRHELGDSEIGQIRHGLLHHLRYGEEAAGILVARLDVDRAARRIRAWQPSDDPDGAF